LIHRELQKQGFPGWLVRVVEYLERENARLKMLVDTYQSKETRFQRLSDERQLPLFPRDLQGNKPGVAEIGGTSHEKG